MKSVKIGDQEYAAIKKISKSRGQFVSFTLNQAIRFYLGVDSSRLRQPIKGNS